MISSGFLSAATLSWWNRMSALLTLFAVVGLLRYPRLLRRCIVNQGRSNQRLIRPGTVNKSEHVVVIAILTQHLDPAFIF
jgi:hypothetical protein